ncbi:hypothetical protein ABZ297_19620 [Nonomuraea sp. NPDC005983]|uniref:trypsin-like serine peptidase n=1 Tax=Nonomuraea sp. NPDC005983 TaxID=3155595 RepID=UPI0033B67F3F
MLRLALSLVLLAPTGVSEASLRNVPVNKVLTPGGDRLGYAPVPRPYTGARRLTGALLGRDSVTGTHVLCGGSVIDSPSRSLVLTAAHCLYHEGRRLKEVAFLPGFDRGYPPLGVWPALRTWVPHRWLRRQYAAALPYDVAVVAVGRRGRRLEDVTGGGLPVLPTRRGTSLRGLELLSYPAGRRYPGTRMYRCLGDAAEATDRGPGVLVTRNCHSPAGGSGGPVLSGGAVAGVVSSSSPLRDRNGFTVISRLGGRAFSGMLARADRWMQLRTPA